MTPESCAIMLKWIGIAMVALWTVMAIGMAWIRWREVKAERANPYV